MVLRTFCIIIRCCRCLCIVSLWSSYAGSAAAGVHVWLGDATGQRHSSVCLHSADTTYVRGWRHAEASVPRTDVGVHVALHCGRAGIGAQQQGRQRGNSGPARTLHWSYRCEYVPVYTDCLITITVKFIAPHCVICSSSVLGWTSLRFTDWASCDKPGFIGQFKLSHIVVCISVCTM